MSLEQADAAAGAVATAPRVSLADIHAAIAGTYSFNAADAIDKIGLPVMPELKLLTISLVVMKNGFVVVGKSAPASPENYNKELGEQLANEDALRQIWPLMGFALREHLAEKAAKTVSTTAPLHETDAKGG